MNFFRFHFRIFITLMMVTLRTFWVSFWRFIIIVTFTTTISISMMIMFIISITFYTATSMMSVITFRTVRGFFIRSTNTGFIIASIFSTMISIVFPFVVFIMLSITRSTFIAYMFISGTTLSFVITWMFSFMFREARTFKSFCFFWNKFSICMLVCFIYRSLIFWLVFKLIIWTFINFMWNIASKTNIIISTNKKTYFYNNLSYIFIIYLLFTQTFNFFVFTFNFIACCI